MNTPAIQAANLSLKQLLEEILQDVQQNRQSIKELQVFSQGDSP